LHYPDPIEFFHYRDRDDFEVDIVLEFSSAALAGIEVNHRLLWLKR
jgi:hypothetical protein